MKKRFLRYGLFASLILILVICATSLPASSENIVYPSDAVINVKTQCGAVGNGASDDTAAIQTCIKRYGKFDSTSQTTLIAPIYFPNGTYLISSSITWLSTVNLFGQSTDGVVIKLKNNAPGFQDSTKPQFMIGMGANQKDNSGFGAVTDIFNMTFDIGSGNSGAIAISFYASNQGGIRDINIRSSDSKKAGFAGIKCRSGAGPALVKNVSIDGFKYGILIGSGVVYENITLSNQQSAGLYSDPNSYIGVGVAGPIFTVHKLISTNAVPVIDSGNIATQITVVDGKFLGGSSRTSAIISKGPVFVRNVGASGYAAIVDDLYNHKKVGTTSLAEYAGERYGLFVNAPKSLNLAIEDTPTTPYDPVSSWASVGDFGASSNDTKDDTAAIQAAIDSGASTIYFPFKTSQDSNSKYLISDTIHIRGNVKRIIGLFQSLYSKSTFADKPIFSIENTTADTIIIEQLRIGARFSASGESSLITHNSSKKLVLRNFIWSGDSIKSAYRGTSSSGNVYLEDVSTLGQYLLTNKNQKLFARQLNANTAQADTVIDNQGAQVWVLQMRPENPGKTVSRVSNGGKTEHIGAWVDTISRAPNPSIPAFENLNSSLSVTANFPAFGTVKSQCCYINFHIAVKESKNGVVKALSMFDLRTDDMDKSFSSGPERVLTLYSSSG